jgi:hypothetical protein
LRRTLTAFSRIDRLGLLVLLYREAELAAEHNVLGELSSQFDEDAGLLFSEALGYDQGAVAYDAILGAVLQAPRSWQPETLGDGGFGDSSCRLPLVRRLVDESCRWGQRHLRPVVDADTKPPRILHNGREMVAFSRPLAQQISPALAPSCRSRG